MDKTHAETLKDFEKELFGLKKQIYALEKKLKEYSKAEDVITFGSIKGQYDVYINDGGGNGTVKRLKKICRINGLDLKEIEL